MKALVTIILLLLFFVTGRSATTIAELRKEASVSPKEALRVLDSLQHDRHFMPYQLDYVRACAYFRLSMFAKALEAAEKSYNSVEVKSDTAVYRKVFMLLAESSVFSFSVEKAVHYIREGKVYASQCSDNVLFASMLLSESNLYRRLSLNQKAYDCVLRAIRMLTDDKSEEVGYHLSHAYGFLMMFYITDGKYMEAWKTGLKREKVVEQLPELWYDNQVGYLYSKMAFLAHMLGREAEEQRFYEKFRRTRFANTSVERLEINGYLLSLKKYEQVIENVHGYIEEIDRKDTLNISYVRLLKQVCVAYEAMHDYQNSYLVAKELLAILESMRQDNERNFLMENADLFDGLYVKEQLADMKQRSQLRGIWIGVLAAGWVLLIGVLLRMAWKDGKMRIRLLELEKLKVLHQYLLKRDSAGRREASAEAGEPLPQEPDVPEGEAAEEASDRGGVGRLSNGELFVRFDRKVRQEKMYLDYHLGRDDYARVMGVDKNRFASVLKECSTGNLAAYLNNLRLEYSVGLFQEHPDWAISRIAEMSALPNLSTFYRLFKEKYGMSPNLFRSKI